MGAKAYQRGFDTVSGFRYVAFPEIQEGWVLSRFPARFRAAQEPPAKPCLPCKEASCPGPPSACAHGAETSPNVGARFAFPANWLESASRSRSWKRATTGRPGP